MAYTKTNFINHFHCLLKGKKAEEPAFNGCFEYLAGVALEGLCQQGTWYDGFILEETFKRKSRQIKLNGKMWVALNKNQWLEPCEITITDKTVIQQSILIKIKIADNEIEKDLDQVWPSD